MTARNVIDATRAHVRTWLVIGLMVPCSVLVLAAMAGPALKVAISRAGRAAGRFVSPNRVGSPSHDPQKEDPCPTP